VDETYVRVQGQWRYLYRAIRNVFGDRVTHRTNRPLDNHLEQDHRGIKQRYRLMYGLKPFDNAVRFCRLFDEIRASLRPLSRRNQALSLMQRRDIHRAICLIARDDRGRVTRVPPVYQCPLTSIARELIEPLIQPAGDGQQRPHVLRDRLRLGPWIRSGHEDLPHVGQEPVQRVSRCLGDQAPPGRRLASWN
jgi:DDE domain